jgi:hypothetical protein
VTTAASASTTSGSNRVPPRGAAPPGRRRRLGRRPGRSPPPAPRTGGRRRRSGSRAGMCRPRARRGTHCRPRARRWSAPAGRPRPARAPRRWSFGDDWLTAQERLLLLVELPVLREDRVGDGDLAEVAQVARLDGVPDVVGREIHAAGYPLDQRSDLLQLVVQLGVALVQRMKQHVLALVVRGPSLPALLGVHALVRQAQRLGGVLGLHGQQGVAVGRVDPETAAVLGQGCRGRRDGRLGPGCRRDRGEDAELVTAQPVSTAVRRDRRGKGTPEPGQQVVARAVPEGVVVRLRECPGAWSRRSSGR